MISLLRRRHRRRSPGNLSTLWVAQFVNTAGLMMLVPIMPLHMESLGAAPTQVGLWAGAAIAAPALPLALTTPWWGRLGDRIGPKWMVVRALLGLAAAMVIMSVAASPAVFVAGRVAQGIFGGVVEAAAAFVAASGSEDKRGADLGKSYGAMAAGSLVGPLAGGVLVGGDGLPVLMAGFAVLAVGLAAYCTLRLPVGERSAGARAVAEASGNGRRWLRHAIRTLGGRVLLAGAVAYVGIYGLIPVYALFVAEAVTDSASVGPWVGALHAIMWAGTFFGSTWWGRRNDGAGSPLRTFSAGAVLTASAIGLQALLPHPVALAPLRFAQGWGFAALAQSLILHASRSSPTGAQSSYAGLTNSFLLAGQFAGPLAAGALMAGVDGRTAVGTAAAVVALAALVLRRAHPSPSSTIPQVEAATEPEALGRPRDRRVCAGVSDRKPSRT